MQTKESISACLSVTDQIAKVVLMPGDPLRAKYIAEHYLNNVTCFNTVRNMLGFTGTYKGVSISVMGSGMGIPSIGLYAKELYDQFDVDAIIRIGSCGGLQDFENLNDLILVQGASSNSNYGNAYFKQGQLCALSSFDLLDIANQISKNKNIPYHVGKVFTNDFYYHPDVDFNKKLKETNHLAVEMESAGLFWTANACNKKALSILTVSDHMFKKDRMSAKQREESFHNMMEVALETSYTYIKSLEKATV